MRKDTATIHRGNKRIIIYMNDGQWGKFPNLDFIADAEIIHFPPEKKKEKKSWFYSLIGWFTKRIGVI